MQNLVLVVNSGSSSLKFQLIEMTINQPIAKGIYERIGLEKPTFTLYYEGQKISSSCWITCHKDAVQHLINQFLVRGILNSLEELVGIGHRVAHGGNRFKTAVIIDNQVEQEIESLGKLAPLHNPINLAGIRAFKETIPNIMQVAVFDTAFHQSMDDVHKIYPIDLKYYEKYGVRRYGFHGISHQYISEYVAKFNPESRKLISAHLGNGSSICAIQDGESYMTSMGFTPLAGLMMGTRCGDIDPAILTFLAREEGLSIEQLDSLLNQSSGFLGISGLSSDLRDIVLAANEGHREAKLAIDIFIERIYATIGSYVAELNGLDTLVFTAGIGENAPEIRAKICQNLSYLGLKIDEKKNKSGEMIISSLDSKVCVMVIPTNEELMIARQVFNLARETLVFREASHA